MLSLILDTSTENLILCLATQQKILSSVAIPHKNNLSALLVPEIQAILKKNNYNPTNLSCLHVGIGPGSYTGIRVGVIAAECLALGLHIPLYSFVSLLAFLPKDLPIGPFSCLWQAKHSSHFLLQGLLEEQDHISNLHRHILPQDQLSPLLNANTSLIAFQSDQPLLSLPSLLYKPEL